MTKVSQFHTTQFLLPDQITLPTFQSILKSYPKSFILVASQKGTKTLPLAVFSTKNFIIFTINLKFGFLIYFFYFFFVAVGDCMLGEKLLLNYSIKNGKDFFKHDYLKNCMCVGWWLIDSKIEFVEFIFGFVHFILMLLSSSFLPLAMG